MINVVLVAFASYRLAHMIVAEDGPADVFMWWRSWLYQKGLDNHWVGRGFNCVLCVSFWTSCLVALLVWDSWANWVLVSLSSAGLVLVLHRLLYK